MARKKAENSPSFEQALEELEFTVQKLENSELKLDEAIELFGQGIKLVGFCNGKLESVQQQVDKILQDAKGEPVIEQFSLLEE